MPHPVAPPRPARGRRAAPLLALLAAAAVAGCAAPPVRVAPIGVDQGAARVFGAPPSFREPTAAVRALGTRGDAEDAVRAALAATAADDWRGLATVAEFAWRRGEYRLGAARSRLFLTAARTAWRALVAAPEASGGDPAHTRARQIHALATARWIATLDAPPRDAFACRDVTGPLTCRVVRDPGPHADPGWYDRLQPAWSLDVVGFAAPAVGDGIGAPFVGLRENDGRRRATEVPFPPEGRTHALTAVLRERDDGVELAWLDPLATRDVPLGATRSAPLAADFAAPYGLLLSRTALGRLADSGFFEPDDAEARRGIYLLQPYDRDRTVVLMVHGLWSGPYTWFELTNRIWADPELRHRVQIWHAIYPTGVPILNNARELREGLRDLLARLDPEADDPASRDVVLVGHSMGGVLSKLLVSDSGDAIWNARFRVPLEALDVDPADRDLIARTYRFAPLDAVRMAILLGAPLGGSPYTRTWIAALGRTMVDAGSKASGYLQRLVSRNPEAFRAGPDTPTSLDVLDPDHPVIREVRGLPVAAGVPVHTIVGRLDADGPLEASSDGVVPYPNAHYPDAASETVVVGDHSLPVVGAAIERVLALLRGHHR